MEESVEHLPPFPSFGTLSIHAGQEPEQFPGWSVVAPISMSVTFKQEAPGKFKVPHSLSYPSGSNILQGI